MRISDWSSDVCSSDLSLALAAVALASTPARAEVSAETAFIFNTFSFLVGGFLVMWMAAGFAMLEAGLVRTKNTATICLKNIAIFAISAERRVGKACCSKFSSRWSQYH